MSGENFPENAEIFAAGLMVQAVWPILLVVAAVMAAPVIGLVAGPQTTALSAAAWLVAAASAVATLTLSALLLFDALLFRLMASHASEAAGGAVVDDVLARMRLKSTTAGGRSLDHRMAGTRRLLTRQRMALAMFAAASLFAAFV
ncbi:hypothetical protein NKH85_26900 [Mesorhizobium sp. M0924]|uniref:hypothetical protein n=1 Tax=unclassified Mesorhizobium TaxID=325217 RepID=UPI0003CEBA3C|nr:MULTISPECIES: hypothetical protein [unclassified Mesorhizobium]ESY28801.1 hypothetical protein X748_28765 [Mesorhizobium sp. LNJC386A00]ESY29191.1 hypothetical protein X749_16670 [Mesorhizobium sp. LNJC391B00]